MVMAASAGALREKSIYYSTVGVVATKTQSPRMTKYSL
jgi:hypothetical protein